MLNQLPADPSSIVESQPEIMKTLFDISQELRLLRAEVVALRGCTTLPQTSRTHYTVEEAAKMIGRSSYTCREWCRQGQVNAVKRTERRGAVAIWSISTEEITRYRNEELLPVNPDRNNRN